MQFLFVALMSVLVGASALPHLMQAPNRPSFSLRKNTSFSVVSIPRFLEKVAKLEIKLKALEEEQLKKKKEADERAAKIAAGELDENGEPIEPVEDQRLLASVEEEREQNSNSLMSDYDIPNPNPIATLSLREMEARACICADKDKGVMSCKVWIEGTCSHLDEYVTAVALTDQNQEYVKSFRCKESNRYSGFVPIRGGGAAKLTLSFMDQKMQRLFNLINHCGNMGTTAPIEDE